MTDNPDILVGIAGVGVPGLATIFTWVFGKPSDAAVQLSHRRLRLLTTIRLRVANRLVQQVPLRNPNEPVEDQIARARDAFVEVLAHDHRDVVDYTRCEPLYAKAIRAFRRFKNGSLALLPGSVAALITSAVMGVEWARTVFLLPFSIGCVLFLVWLYTLYAWESSKDTYEELCDSYEVD